MKTKPRTIRKEVFLPHPPEEVWLALTDPQALAEWLMPNNFEPVVGRKFRFQVDPMPGPYPGGSECEVLEVDAPRRLVYKWACLRKDQTTGAGTFGIGAGELLAAILNEYGLGPHDQQAPAQSASQREGWPFHTGRDRQTQLWNENGSSGLCQIDSNRGKEE
jgi:uncharacterized protein YndB with AHSA1/START domain